MKNFKKISLLVICMSLVMLSALVFTGCGKHSETCKLYVFAQQGGYVKVDEHEQIIEFGDEGSRYFVYDKNTTITLKAIANEGYCFVQWLFTDALADKYENLMYDSECEIVVADEKVVVKAMFALDASLIYGIQYSNGTGYTIEPLSGYSNTVALGGDFKFKVNLLDDYNNSDITVKVNDKGITSTTEGVYIISNINRDINISVEGVVKNQESVEYETYVLNLDLEENVKSLIPDILTYIPATISISISEDAEKLEQYTASTFMVTTAQNLQISIKDFIDNINDYLEENPSVYTSVSCLQINNAKLIEVVDDIMYIDWTLLVVSSSDVIIALQ